MVPGVQVVAELVIVAVPILAAIVFHEVAHGAVAYAFGDPTAARHGRLTLNPLPHIDPFGTVILPGLLMLAPLLPLPHIDPFGTVILPGLLMLAPLLFGTRPFIFGYARPVPVDVRRLGHPRRDAVLVAMAGPATNLALATLSAAVLAWLPSAAEPTSLLRALALMAR